MNTVLGYTDNRGIIGELRRIARTLERIEAKLPVKRKRKPRRK